MEKKNVPSLIEIQVWHQWNGGSGDKSCIRDVWVFWADREGIDRNEGAKTVEHLLTSVFKDMLEKPEDKHFNVMTGGLSLSVWIDKYGDAAVVLSVTTHRYTSTYKLSL